MSTPAKSLDWSLLIRILRLARPYRLILSATLLLAILLAPLGILRPYLIEKMVDQYILQHDAEGLLRMTIWVFIILMIEVIARYTFTYWSNWLGQQVVRDLRVQLFKKILYLRQTYFDTTPIGVNTTRTISDIENINSVFAQGVITILADIIGILVVICIMFYVSVQLTLVCLATMPLLIIASYIFKEKVKASFQQVRNHIARLNTFLQERISGMRVIQIFNAEESQLKKFQAINADYTKANVDAIFYYAVFFPVVEIISALTLGLMVWWGSRSVLHSEISIGVLIAFPLYLNMMFRPIRMLADKFNTLQMGLVAAGRVFQIIDNREDEQSGGDYIPGSLRGEIEFRDVNFSYVPGETVLQQCDLHIQPQETVAIVGSTGSGKSTLVQLLNRLYEPVSGTIFLDGIPLHRYDVATLRSRIAVMTQDVFLFSGSIYDNITLHDASISKETVEEAAKLIGVHGFIESLPGGYQYNVGERGVNLSMGQRQLISFIRAMCSQPEILILDEATANVDQDSELLIQSAIQKMLAQRTSLIIAHRLSTIRYAHRIVVLEKGKILEQGTHEVLMQNPTGRYRNLYESQFSEGISNSIHTSQTH